VLTERAGLELVALRGRLMQEAGETNGDGGMIALLGADAAAARRSRPSRALDRQRQLATAGGALRSRAVLPEAEQAARSSELRAIILPVTGAFTRR